MSIEFSIIKSFMRERKVYTDYIKSVRKLSFPHELKELLKLIDGYYSTYIQHEYISRDELVTFYQQTCGDSKIRNEIIDLIERISQVDTSDTLAVDVIRQLIEKDCANQIVNTCIPLLEGRATSVIERVETLVTSCKTDMLKTEKRNPFIESNLDDLIQSEVHTDGLRWRLRCLNDDLGPLRGGNLIHVYARPDTGKTTFLISEISGIAESIQTDDQEILWINNEERGRKLKLRLYCGVIGAPLEKIVANREQAQELFLRRRGNQIKLYDDASVSTDDIYRLLNERFVRLLMVDQGDKIIMKGDGDAPTHEKLQRLYGRFRELAKEFDIPIITVGQAGDSATGRKWLDLNDMNNSKTGKPGELDAAIGIGRIPDEEDDSATEHIRYIHLSKNKMGPEGKHGKHVCMIDTQRVRYRDV